MGTGTDPAAAAQATTAPRVCVDCVVIGGGVAGLWTLRAALDAGYSAALVERTALGSGQTIASQGIIHGGIKYVLTGFASPIARAVSRMPEVWRERIDGRGSPSLTSVRVLSEHQYLWTAPGLSSRLAGLAASRLIDAEVDRVGSGDSDDDRIAPPPALRGVPPGTDIYRVQEPILEPHSLVTAISRPVRDCLIRGRVAAITPVPAPADPPPASDVPGASAGVLVRVEMLTEIEHGEGSNAGITESPAGEIELLAAHVVLCAGAGNEALISLARGVMGSPGAGSGTRAQVTPDDDPARMQRRPLRMVMVRRDPDAAPRLGELPEVFGHAIEASSVPRVSLTTSRSRDGSAVWYIGGSVAERGADLDEAATIALAREELADAIPWVSLDGTQWATLAVDRAEGWQRDAKRPDRPVIELLREPGGRDHDASERASRDRVRAASLEHITVCWPTKLAFAPLAADLCLRHVEASAGEREPPVPGAAAARTRAALAELKDVPRPRVALLPWDEPEVVWKNASSDAPA